jgi:hypothetical protein
VAEYRGNTLTIIRENENGRHDVQGNNQSKRLGQQHQSHMQRLQSDTLREPKLRKLERWLGMPALRQAPLVKLNYQGI